MADRAGRDEHDEFEAAGDRAEAANTPDSGSAADSPETADTSDTAGSSDTAEFAEFGSSEGHKDEGHEDADEDDDAVPFGLDDLSVMHSDDALLSALGGSDPGLANDVDERELNELLLAWRRDIDSEPMAELVDTDTAVATINAAAATRKRPRSRGHRAFVPVAAAAAVLAIAFTGTGLAARSAEPGDALWGLTQVLYTDHAQSVQAAASARLNLDTADFALSQGRFGKAEDALNSAAEAIRHIQPGNNQQELQVKHRKLEGKLPPPAPSTESSPASEQSSSQTSESTTGSSGESSSEKSESSSSSTSSESDRSSKPTTSSQPELPPSLPSTTPTPSSTSRSESQSQKDTTGFSPNLQSGDSRTEVSPPS